MFFVSLLVCFVLKILSFFIFFYSGVNGSANKDANGTGLLNQCFNFLYLVPVLSRSKEFTGKESL